VNIDQILHHEQVVEEICPEKVELLKIISISVVND
jgi:hypothetical protein